MTPRQKIVAPHQWSESRGPVVPHDTFPRDCSLCHEKGGWDKIRSDFRFDHAQETGVALVGAHQHAECLRCHNDRGPVSVFARRGCVGCHQDEHRGQLGSRCIQCHNESNWVPEEQIVLHNRTRFPLVGAHTAVACFRCHPGAQVGNFVRAPVRCEVCHQQDVARAKQPDHVAQGWTENCDRCHKSTTWSGAGFDHSRFPLTGAHMAASCSACHSSGVFSGLPHNCVDCHLPDFQSAATPNHVAGNFSTNCQSCHNTLAWRGATFNHAGITSNCVQCHLPDFQSTVNPNHVAGNFSTNCESCHNTMAWRDATFNHAGITSNCVQCHLPDFQSTVNPNHVAGNFSTNCESCHSTTSWQGATFNHAGITSGCVQCHLPDFQSTVNPNHVAGNFSTNCESCHSTTSWQGATFNHAGITSGCVQCHLPDFQSTVNPNHLAAGFPQNCESCHNTNTWTGAVFTHRFNINSGPHRSFNCSECHQTPTNYRIVSCTHCHEHRQAKADDKHSGVPGYVWSSASCLSCHPNGN